MQKTLKKYFPIFIIPTLIAFIIAFVVPFIMGVYLSFCKFTTVLDAKFIGFDNYIKAFSNKEFLNALGFTAAFAVVSIITINIFAFGLAFILTRKIRGSHLFRTVFFMPNLIGGLVLGYIWQLIINGFLAKQQITMLADPKYGFMGLVILMNWQLIGYMMVIYIAGIQNVPKELMDAAAVDGANGFQRLKNVIIDRKSVV